MLMMDSVFVQQRNDNGRRSRRRLPRLLRTTVAAVVLLVVAFLVPIASSFRTVALAFTPLTAVSTTTVVQHQIASSSSTYHPRIQQQQQQPFTVSSSSSSSSIPSNGLYMSKCISDPLPNDDDDDDIDVIVIGSGLAGLSCAALLAHCHQRVVVLESHDIPGGCAHSWERRGYHFESGPSLYSGMSDTNNMGSPNPLKNIFQIVNEDCEWITYDRWGTVLPNGEKFAAKIGPEEFESVVLQQYGGPNATTEFATLMNRMRPISDAAQALTSMALREDIGVAITLLLRYPDKVLLTLSQGSQLTNPFATIMKELNIKDPFIINWLDMLCFLLQGLPASGTLNTVMAYMLADWYRPGVTLDYPKGGSGAIVEALIRAIRKPQAAPIQKQYGTVTLNSHVDEIIIENNKAVGVRINGHKILRAKRAIVSNADPYITNQLLNKAREEKSISQTAMDFFNQLICTDPETGGIQDLKSFIHLHAGINGTGLPVSPSRDFPAQWAVIRNWDGPTGVEDPRNIVLCSVPSMLDPDMAPDGNHAIHAYTPATEPYEWWEGLDRTSEEYRKKKDEAGDFLWKAISEYIPDAKDRAIPGTVQIGTPLTHERFLRRTRGAYGPRVDVGTGQTLPGHTTPIRQLYMCGDYTFPSIGVPATAASGAITANTIVSIWDHWKMLDKIRLPK